MPRLTALTTGRLLDALASREPLPAGGSAAALAGAAGVSLLIKVWTIAGGDEADAARIEALRRTRDSLVALIDRDADAYANVLAARRSPRATPADAAQREALIASAMRRATEAPLETMRACRKALAEAVVVAGRASRATRADVRIAVDLLLAGAAGAGACVDGNLASMPAGEAADGMRRERERLDAESAEEGRRARGAIGP